MLSAFKLFWYLAQPYNLTFIYYTWHILEIGKQLCYVLNLSLPVQKGPTDYQGKTEQMTHGKWVNWLSMQNRSTNYQGKMDNMVVSAKGSNNYQGKREQPIVNQMNILG